MPDERKVWELMGETSGSIFPLAQEVMRPQLEEHFSERRFYPLTFTAAQMAPRPISAELLNRRNPYANPARTEALLREAAQAGYLDPDGQGGYLVSERGAKAIQDVHGVFYKQINQINRFPKEKLQELDALLEALVSACAKADFPDGALRLEISHNGHPGVEPASLARIDQLLDDMNAFRDDAHVAAWSPAGVDGHTWEVLTYVWNGEANTVEKLVEALPYRTYAAEDYAATLNELTTRGWIEPVEEGYQVTGTGKRIRDQAEDQTNANYFSPWKALTDEEVDRLGQLLQELKEINLEMAEEKETDPA